jgi:hypothetical protein
MLAIESGKIDTEDAVLNVTIVDYIVYRNENNEFLNS